MEGQRKLNQGPCSHIDIQEHDIFQNMKAAKKTDSVPGQIPSSILQEFLPEFATQLLQSSERLWSPTHGLRYTRKSTIFH